MKVTLFAIFCTIFGVIFLYGIKASAAEPIWTGGPYVFSGSSTVESETNIGIVGNAPFTIAVKVNVGANAKDDYGNGIIGWGSASKNSGNFIYYNSAANSFEYGFYANDGETAPSYPKDNDYFIINTWDGHMQKIYINGELAAQREREPLTLTDSPVIIGADPFGQGRNFNGTVTSAQIFDCALTETEVFNMMGKNELAFLTPLKNAYTNDVKIQSAFWKSQVKRMITKWIPHCIDELNTLEYGIAAFENAGQKLAGGQYSVPNQDPWANAYTHNTIEAMCLALTIDADGDAEITAAQVNIKRELERWIPIVLSAQESDGYLNTNYTLNNKQRWSVKTDHEGYVMGYFIEAALAHYALTDFNDTRLYNAAVKCADLWVSTIGAPPKKFWYDGHEGMEMALVRLGRFVNEREGSQKGDKYIELAQFLCDARGNGSEYDQSHLSATEQSEAVGHAVRATYLYSAMTDIAMEKKNNIYYNAVKRLWDSTVNHKMYITGGIGSIASNEGFTDNYVLPNKSYNESCASCGMVFWNNRMNNAFHDSRYIDNLERQMYNVVLGAVSLEGESFYYQNELDANWSRYSWHVCPCCVGNIPRTILSLPQLMYSTEGEDTLYINMLAGSTVKLSGIAGTDVEIVQQTDYPWRANTKIIVNPSADKDFTIKLRVPKFEETSLYTFSHSSDIYTVDVNGAAETYPTENGYVVIKRIWSAGDYISLDFPMEIKRIYADPRIEADNGRVALARGPIVYNLEDVDNSVYSIGSVVIDDDSTLTTRYDASVLEGVTLIQGKAKKKTSTGLEEIELTAIPNYARLNRGGRSIVWAAHEAGVADTDDAWASSNNYTTYNIGKYEKRAIFSYSLSANALSDGLVGFAGSDVNPNAFTNFSMVIRIKPDGTMDARNGSAFGATNTIYYTTNKTYIITVALDVPNKKYSVFVSDEGGITTLLAEDFAFRSDAPEVSDISKVCVRGGNGVAAGLFNVWNFEATAGDAKVVYTAKTSDKLFFNILSAAEAVYDIYIASHDGENILQAVDKRTETFEKNEIKSFDAELIPNLGAKLLVWYENSITAAD
ncbi:MAG: glycoside hydrolase family 127 protein [Clostridia bacterium]|nr:glycoside hydrolase family 127 protein [Clostridia bacterium]